MTRQLVAAASGTRPRTPEAAVRLEVLTDVESILAARASIEALCDDLYEANIYFEPWFLFPAIEHLGADVQFAFLCIYETAGRQRLCGFLPLCESRLHPILPLRTYRVWGHSQCFRCTPLVRRGFAEAFWRATLSWLEERSWHRRLLDLQRLPAEGDVWRALQSVLIERRSFRTLLYRYETAVLRIGSSYDDALDRAMSRSTRRRLAKKGRRLARAGSSIYAEAGEGCSIDRFIEEFLELEASGWKGEAGTALASNGREAAFFREVVRAAHERGRLLFLSLRLDGRLIAARCAFLAPPGAFVFKSAFDEAFRRFSPGTLTAMEETRRLHDPEDRLRGGLTWADSCAGPGDGPTYRCWPDRMAVAGLRIASRWSPHALPMRFWPVVQRMARALSRDAHNAGYAL